MLLPFLALHLHLSLIARSISGIQILFRNEFLSRLFDVINFLESIDMAPYAKIVVVATVLLCL